MPSFLHRLFTRRATAPSRATPADSREPSLFGALYARASSAAATGNVEDAIRLFEEAVAADPSQAEAYYKRANLLKSAGRLDAAIVSYNQAIERKPDYTQAFCNRGVVQHSLGLLEAALSSYDRAIALNPGDFMAHYNRGLLMQDCSRWDEALASYERAVAINPQFADAQYNRSMAQLFLGDFRQGWQGYEWRWINAQRLGIGDARNFAQPRWLGNESIAGRRLLLYSEGGLGDTLQFCRYATLCARAGAIVILEAQAPLLGLLKSLEGVSRLIASGSALPSFDYQCPLLSLPLAFKTTVDAVPAPARYLHADASRVAEWRVRLGEQRRPRIGLAWSGNPKNTIDARRSVRLADLIGHLPKEFDYFRLQTQVRDTDRAVLESNPFIVSFDDDLLCFENTAALCQCLDLVITVDTSLAHLGGALGARTWVLLPRTPDFRWLRDRDDTPWYPSLTLYRQSTAGEWGGVFERVAADLRSKLLEPRQLANGSRQPSN
jgi:tetratricopeptide (TPR) repeat protein